MQLSAYAEPIDTPRYSLKHFTDEDGLPQNSVKAIAKDKDGFIWLTTEDGIVRFDGRHFVTFSTGNMDISSSRFSRILSIGSDSFLYARNNEFEWVSIKNGKAMRDTAISFKKSTDVSFLEIIGQHKRYEATGKPNPTENLVFEEYLVTINKNEFFLCTHEKVSYYKNKKLVIEFPFVTVKGWSFFPINSILYHISDNNTFTSLSANGQRPASIKGDLVNDPALKKEKVEVFWDYISGNVLFYLRGSYYKVKGNADGTLQTTLIASGFNAQNNLVGSAYYDEERGELFLGSITKGLFVIKRKDFATLTDPSADPDDIFYGQALYNGESIITPQGLLFHEKDKPKLFPLLKELSSLDKYAIIQDDEGFIWLNNSDRLYKVDAEARTVVTTWQLPDNIAVFNKGKKGRIWICLRKKGLYYIDTSEKDAVPHHFLDMPGLSCTLQQNEDTMWLGSYKGLYKISLKNKKIDTIKGLQEKYIRSLYLADGNKLFVATYGHGFFMYGDNELVSFPTDREKYLLTAHCIIEDKKGFFWITTNKGLFQVAKSDLLAYAKKEQENIYYYYYDRENGFNTNEFNGGCDPCGISLPNGNISFPSINGLVLFSPEAIQPILPSGKIFIDKVQLDNQQIEVVDNIKLPHSFKQLQLFISSPYLGNKKNISFSYALTKKGDSPLWLKVEDDGVISFSTLPAGSYTLSIRKLNGFGKNNFTQKDISIHVAAAWYQTIWFLFGIVLLTVLLTFLVTRIRSNYIIRNNKMLEAKIAERTEKLQQTLTHLEQTQNDLQQKTYLQEHLIAAISHDIKTPMKYIVLTLQKIYAGLKKENSSAFIETSKVASDYISQLYGSLDNLIQYIKAQKDKSYILSDNFSLYQLVSDKVKLFSEPAKRRDTKLINNVPANFNINSSKQLLSIILRNIIDNAVKNTSAGSIIISAVKTKEGIEIIVADTGYGMSEELVNWLNNETATTRLNDNEASFSASSGLGLIIVKELAPLISIKVVAESEKGIGSTIHLFVKQ